MHANLSFLGVLLLPFSAFGQELAFERLAEACDFEAHRIKSADPKGGNEDWRLLQPGGTLELADITGSGCIVRLRDRITSKEAHYLQYHVLRMYWDGERDPSVPARQVTL